MWLKFGSSLEGKPLVATLGNFDGCHLGHQFLLKKTIEAAKDSNLESALITFHPHPVKVLGGVEPKKLTNFRQLAQLVRAEGIDNLIVLRFTRKLAELPPESFVDHILLEKLEVRKLIIGPFASIGKDRKGTPQWIKEYFSNKGLSAQVVDPLITKAVRVSSNQIRQLVESGDLNEVVRLLGRPFVLSSRVVEGDKRGRLIGFPTANMNPKDYVLPPDGVYFGKAEVAGHQYWALTNIGQRPTFNGKRKTIESYLLDFQGQDFYGRRMELQLIERIRDEVKFSSAEELIKQIELDLKKAKELILEKSK